MSFKFPSMNGRFLFRLPRCGISQSIFLSIGVSQTAAFFATRGVVGYVEDCKEARTPAWTERCRLWMETRSYT